MPKYFVLDTNILLHNGAALEAFEDNYVVLPITVIEELDRFKTHADELGRNARASIRYIDGLRIEEEAYAQNEGREPDNLMTGIKNNAGGKLMIITPSHIRSGSVPDVLDDSVPDNRILRAALYLHNQGHKVILVTKDLNLRIKASILGIEPQDWEADKVDANILYSGYEEVSVTPEEINLLYAENKLHIPGFLFYPNQFVILTAAGNRSQSAIGKAIGPNEIAPLNKAWSKAYGISGRSAEQRMALQLLLDPNIKLVTLIGSAGTGKTLLALAGGLEAMRIDDIAIKDGKNFPYNYEKMLVTRPVIPMGKDIGYLPGSKDKKMAHWMQPVFDNLSFLMQVGPGAGKHLVGKAADRKVQELLDDDMVELEALTYIRGRSISKQFIVVDEAQNLTPHEVKTIISRAGEGTKIVLTGDPDQIDNPYLDSSSNGLCYVAERMKSLELFGNVVLKKAERSELAAAAAREL